MLGEGLCPPYLLPSTPINGLCVPEYALASPEEAEAISIIIERIQVSNTQMLEPEKVLEGSKYALEKLGTSRFWEKSPQDFFDSKGHLVLAVFLSISFFLFWVLLLFILQINTIVIEIFLFLDLLVLTLMSAFSFYNGTKPSETVSTQVEEDFVNSFNMGFWVFLGVSFLVLSSVYLVCILFVICNKLLCPSRPTKDWLGKVEKATKLIKEAILRIFRVKPVLLVPAIFSLPLKLTVLLLTIYSSILLASPSTKEFRVVGSCPEELCISNQTQTFFQEGDLCVPDHFR